MKVMVFGGSGMLGHVVVKHLVNKSHDVTFSVRDSVPKWMPLKKPVGLFKFTTTDKIPDLTGFDWVVNCVGAIKQNKDLKASDFYETNSVFPWKLALACKKTDAKLIHVSSDCVFSGKKVSGSYAPTESMDAEDDYGISKILGECSDAVILRTSIIGPAEKNLGLFQWFMSETNDVTTGYTNHLWSGVTTLFLAQFIESLMTAPTIEIPPEGGLIQIASKPIDKCLLLNLIQDVFVEQNNKKTIIKTETEVPVNRTLSPSVGYANDIHAQLVELRDWMKIYGS